MVSIGLNAATGIQPSWLEIPGGQFRFQYGASAPEPHQLTTDWTTWVLTNGFRDVAESIAETLEEIHQVLALWSITPVGGSGTIALKDFQDVQASLIAFHKRNLPQKLDVLRDRFDFAFSADMQAELLSINAARNCLVHRAGIVGATDIDNADSNVLTLRWRSLDPFIKDSLGERPLKLPFQTSATDQTELVLKVLAKTRSFQLGMQVALDQDEFSGIAWTLFTQAQAAATQLEQLARARGLPLVPSNMPTDESKKQ